MKKIKDKWKGLRITLNYFGKSNNRFGLKKKIILLEENKIHSLSDLIELNKTNLKETKIYNNNTNKLSKDNTFRNYLRKSKDNINNDNNNNFESIKIKDFEKTKNFNFFNYFQNMRYFNRINSCRRILSSCRTPSINSIKNISCDDEKKEEIKKEKKVTNKNRIKFEQYKKNKILGMSKIDINKIISNYIQKNKKDNDVFNQKNRKINNNLKHQNSFRNSPRIKKNNNYITNITYRKNKNSNDNTKRCDSLRSMHKTSNYLSLRDSDIELNNDVIFQQKLLYFKHKKENNSKKNNAIIFPKKKYYLNNINFQKAKKNFNNFIKKKTTSFVDASTNTDFINNQ